VDGQSELLEIVRTLRSAGSFSRRLHGRQQQGDQNRDNGNNHEKLDQRETASDHSHRDNLSDQEVRGWRIKAWRGLSLINITRAH
jgi:hypothetical protein